MREIFKDIVWREHTFALARMVITFALLVAASVFYFRSHVGLTGAVAAYDSMAHSIEESTRSEQVLKASLDDYVRLRERGYVGKPLRLKWLETLRQISRAHSITGVEFTLDPSELVQQNEDAFWHPTVAVRATGMTITMQLAHEGDLHRLLSDLAAQAPGLVSVESCTLYWLQDTDEELLLTRLRGECNLRWYTVDDVMDEWSEGSI